MHHPALEPRMSPASPLPVMPASADAAWAPDSWRSRPALQMPLSRRRALASAQDELRSLRRW